MIEHLDPVLVHLTQQLLGEHLPRRPVPAHPPGGQHTDPIGGPYRTGRRRRPRVRLEADQRLVALQTMAVLYLVVRIVRRRMSRRVLKSAPLGLDPTPTQ